MKIDINKDFEKAFPDDLWKGFTLKQIITFSVGLIMAAVILQSLSCCRSVSSVSTNTRTIPCGRCTKRCGFTGQLKNLLMGRKKLRRQAGYLPCAILL